MTVGEQVRDSLNHWSARQWRQSMWHASEALDETARKRYPTLGVAARFKRTVRDDLDIFTAMMAPDIDLVRSRFPVRVQSDATDGRPDVADLLFATHRYLHGHENDFPGGCEIMPHIDGVPAFHISEGHLQLRASAALGLLAIAVFSPENRGEQIPGSYQLGWQQHIFHVRGWWGWRDHFREILRTEPIPSYPLDFGPEWSNWQPVR
ncbi:MAG: hypothetical protein KDB71_17325 [Mycobacterium sp.]|nr:hypothetical protein [Mycobacterium sp.]